MTAADLDAQTAASAVALPPHHLACPMCGVATRLQTRTAALTVEALGRAGEPAPPPGSGRRAAMRTRFARCPACADAFAVATRLCDAHRSVSARLGGGNARHRTECALAALAAVGHRLPTGLLSADEFSSLLANLTVVGASARWQSLFAPVLRADPTTCNPYPWAHLSDELRSQLSTSVATLLAERVAMTALPLRLTPPSPGLPGCLLCGVGHVSVAADRAVRLGGRQGAQRKVWHPQVAPSQALGGQPGSERISGYVCPPCHDAVAAVGSVGQTAMERALVAHLRSVGRGDDARRVAQSDEVRLVGWGALADAAARGHRHVPSPDGTPWAHLVI